MERRRFSAFRVADRTLSGTVLTYGTEARVADADGRTREMVVPGAFGSPLPDVALDLEHDPAMVVVPRLALDDGPDALRCRADLPETSAAVKLVRAGRLRGFSVAFQDLEVERRGGVDVVMRARLTAVSLVGDPAYRESLARVRGAPGRSTVPVYLL